jgi:hypothetical protein
VIKGEEVVFLDMKRKAEELNTFGIEPLGNMLLSGKPAKTIGSFAYFQHDFFLFLLQQLPITCIAKLSRANK